MNLLGLKTEEERLEAVKKVAHTFENIAENDLKRQFPFKNVHKLKNMHYLALSLPKSSGGLGIRLQEFIQHQENIAMMDASTALSVGWHMGVASEIAVNKNWSASLLSEVIEAIKQDGALINNAASERGTGSPTRGAKPQTTATKTNDGWILNGRKSFTSLAPALTYAVVTATIEETGEVAQFLVHKDLKGVSVDYTWDSIAMRGTGSHDLVLDQVALRDIDYIKLPAGDKKVPRGWLLHIPACYLGITRAAMLEAVKFARSYSPPGLDGVLSDLPTVQQKLGKMELRYIESKEVLYSVARRWDEAKESDRQHLANHLAAAKITVMNHGIEVVDQAMRLVGARSLSEKHPLQRHYRDIRAGLHNPPMEDMVLSNLSKQAVQASIDLG